MWWQVQRKVGVGKAALQAGCSRAVSLLARAEHMKCSLVSYVMKARCHVCPLYLYMRVFPLYLNVWACPVHAEYMNKEASLHSGILCVCVHT